MGVTRSREPVSASLRKQREHSRLSKRARPACSKRLVSNFAILGIAEVLCRGTSILVTLSLINRLQPAGYGRIEFAFSIVFWAVLVVRDFVESIATRELARKPRLTSSLVNRILTIKLCIALALYLAIVSTSLVAINDPKDRWLLFSYGFLLFTTALGLDFVYRGSEQVGVVAVSLILRTLIYSVGVWLTVNDPSKLHTIPVWLISGEFIGIGLVWAVYSMRFGWPRPRFDRRFVAIILTRGRSTCLIHLCQTVVVSADLIVVGMLSDWSEVGRYGAPHRMVSAAMAFGFIFQQVVFPSLARSNRLSEEAGRRLMNQLVRILMVAFIPVAVGTSLLSESFVGFLFPSDYRDCGRLLAVGIWRAPLLCLAFLYQGSLIAMNRESTGVRFLVMGALGAFPLIMALRSGFGLVGASSAMLLIGVGLAVAGYLAHVKEARYPAWHHHLKVPILASCVMIPVCLALLRVHLLVSVAGGALAYGATAYLLGGLDFKSESLEQA